MKKSFERKKNIKNSCFLKQFYWFLCQLLEDVNVKKGSEAHSYQWMVLLEWLAF